MAIKNFVSEDNNGNNTSRKERFEIVLTINGFIVCQRYFKSRRWFKPQSFTSLELTEFAESCVDIIHNDLKSKSERYLAATAPMVFKNVDEMNEFLAKKPNSIEPATCIIFRESEDVYISYGDTVKPYDKYFNRADYVGNEETTPCVLKFTLYDNGNNLDEHIEVVSKVWDGNVYPRFVRNNIDLTNSKNRYKSLENFSPYEASLIDYLNQGKKDIVPLLTNEFERICTCVPEDEKPQYTTSETYGKGTKYWFNVKFQEELRIKALERQYAKKTEKYFNEIARAEKELESYGIVK